MQYNNHAFMQACEEYKKELSIYSRFLREVPVTYCEEYLNKLLSQKGTFLKHSVNSKEEYEGFLIYQEFDGAVFIKELFVYPAFRRHKVATRLVKDVVKKFPVCYLEILKGNDDAADFWSRFFYHEGYRASLVGKGDANAEAYFYEAVREEPFAKEP